MNAKLSELKPGDKVSVTGFTCIPDHETRTVHEYAYDLYIDCAQGRHFLHGQCCLHTDILVGVTKL